MLATLHPIFFSTVDSWIRLGCGPYISNGLSKCTGCAMSPNFFRFINLFLLSLCECPCAPLSILSVSLYDQANNPLQCDSPTACTCLGDLSKNDTAIHCAPCPNGAAPIRVATFAVPNGCGGCLPNQYNKSGNCVPATECPPGDYVSVNLTATSDRSCAACRPQHFSTQVDGCMENPVPYILRRKALYVI